MYKKRYIRIEPNPFKKSGFKLKQATPQYNSAGYAVVNSEGRVSKTMEDVDDAFLPGTFKYISTAISSRGLDTGLDEIIDNPYKNEPVYNPDWGEKVLKGKEKVLLQHVLEYKHGREFGYYRSNVVDNIYPSDKRSEQPFFSTEQASVPLSNNVTFLDLTNPLHEVWFHILRKSSEVANSYEELDNGRNNAFFYMVSEEEMESVKAEKDRKLNIAAAALEELYKETSDTILKLAKALGNDNKDLTKQTAYGWLNKFFKDNSQDHALFMKYYEMYKDPTRRDYLFAAATLQELIDYAIFRTRDHKIYWVAPESDTAPHKAFEWLSKDEAIKGFLIAPEWQEYSQIAEDLLKTKKIAVGKS